MTESICKKRIILASKSPRRRELLEQIGLDFAVIVSDADENIAEASPMKLVSELSFIKAKAVFDSIDDKGNIVVIGSDTVVAFNDEIMGKPKDELDAKRMLKKLSGNKHFVCTGVTLMFMENDEIKNITFAEKTDVYMYEISDSEIDTYIASGEPMDKAGSYAIQGLSAKFIKKIDGDYNTVVGLPIASVYQKLKEI